MVSVNESNGSKIYEFYAAVGGLDGENKLQVAMDVVGLMNSLCNYATGIAEIIYHFARAEGLTDEDRILLEQDPKYVYKKVWVNAQAMASISKLEFMVKSTEEIVDLMRDVIDNYRICKGCKGVLDLGDLKSFYYEFKPLVDGLVSDYELKRKVYNDYLSSKSS